MLYQPQEVISENILLYMHQNGISRKELSELMEIPYSTICDWIKGRSMPSINSLFKLADKLGVYPSDLLETRQFYSTDVRKAVYNFLEYSDSQPQAMYIFKDHIQACTKADPYNIELTTKILQRLMPAYEDEEGYHVVLDKMDDDYEEQCRILGVDPNGKDNRNQD